MSLWVYKAVTRLKRVVRPPVVQYVKKHEQFWLKFELTVLLDYRADCSFRVSQPFCFPKSDLAKPDRLLQLCCASVCFHCSFPVFACEKCTFTKHSNKVFSITVLCSSQNITVLFLQGQQIILDFMVDN